MKKLILWVAIVVLIVSTGAVAFASLTDTDITVSFRNIKIIHNGTEIKTEFEPFIFNGHTYVSIKDIAKIFNVPIGWNSDNNAIILGSTDKNYYNLSEIPFMEEKLKEQEDGTFINIGSSYNETLSGTRFATIKNKVFKDALLFGGIKKEYFKYELNGKFTSFTFITGATDDSMAVGKDDYATIKIYGDSKLLYSSPPLRPDTGAVFMAIPVKGVNILKIQKELNGTSIIKTAVADGKLATLQK